MVFATSRVRRARPSTILLAAAVLVASTGVLPPAAATAPASRMTVATELLVSPNGNRTIRQLVQDPTTKRWVPLEDTRFAGAELVVTAQQGNAPGAGPPSQLPNLAALGVMLSDRWGGGGTIEFRKAADITNPERNRFRRAARRFVNQNLGHPGVPRADASNQRNVRFRPPSAFQGGAVEAQQQYNRDEINEIGLDEDNVLFTTFISNPHDPENDPIIRAIRFGSGTCTMQGGRWFCPVFLHEGDIFFRNRQTIVQRGEEVTVAGFFEDLDRLTRRELMIAMIKFVQGHFSDAWAHSYQGGNRREIGPRAMNRSNSSTWREARDGDDLLYSNTDPEEGGGAGPPTIRPTRNSVVDVDDLEPPTLRDDDTPAQALFRHNQFAETNLRGYNQRRQIVAEFFEGRNQNNANRILRLSGFAVDRATTLNDGSPGERAYRASHLMITDRDDWERLRDRVVDNGRQDTRANGVGWDRILVVNVCISGHLRDGGGAQRSVCQVYRYAYDIPDQGL